MRSSQRIKLEAARDYPVSVARVWDLLVHCDRFSDISGKKQVALHAFKGGTHLFHQKANTRGWWKRIFHWKEYVHEWVRHQSYGMLREYARGPLKALERGFVIEPIHQGTKLRLFVELSPRWGILRPWMMRWGEKWIQSVFHYCDQYIAIWIQRNRFEYPHQGKFSLRNRHWERELSAFVSTTAETEKLVEKFKQHLMHSYEDEVTQMRPIELAWYWEEDPYQVVRLFLFATKEKLLNLEWVIYCPECFHPREKLLSMSQVPSRAFCDFCQRHFTVDLNRTLEARFSIHPSIRPIASDVGTLNGPSLMPHIWLQHYLNSGESWRTIMELGEDKFRLRTLRTNRESDLIPTLKHSDTLTRVSLVFTREGWLSKTVLFRPGRQELEFSNEGLTPIVVALEKMENKGHVLSGAQVISFEEFHHLFPEEVPQHPLQISNMTFLNVDIRNSTEYFYRLGDQAAIHQVQHVLREVARAVQLFQGAIVKINGDSLLAIYYSAREAVKTAFEVQKAIRFHNKRLEIHPGFELGVSVNQGSAIIESHQGHWDYFGKSVNLVYQMQKLSKGRDVILSKTLFENPIIQQMLKDYLFDHELKDLHSAHITHPICQLTPVFEEVETMDEPHQATRKS